MMNNVNMYIIKANGCNLFYRDLREAMVSLQTIRKFVGEIEYFYKLGVVSRICPFCGAEINNSCKCQKQGVL